MGARENMAKNCVHAAKIVKIFTVVVLALTMGTFAGPSAARLTPTVTAIKKALPWVVNIGTNEQIIQVNDPFNLFFTEYFNRQQRPATARRYSPLGSGVIVDPRGLVLTNSHVVRRAQQIEVRLWDGSAYPARVVGYDAPNDLCLLQLAGEYDGHPLKAAEFAAANDLLLGETVLAVGNPFGLEHSVSQGVISAFNRSFQEGEVSFSDIIQTDAAINPGNSGGPLINLDGQLIGLNLAIRADAQGIGFAIPLARIELFLSYWLKPSHFSDGYLGMTPDSDVEETTADGVRLPALLEKGPLAKAGLKAGTVIAAVAGKAVRRPVEFARAIWGYKAGDEVELTLADGTKHKVKVERMPSELLVQTRLGLKLQELTPRVRGVLGIPEDVRGIMVSEVVTEPFFGMQETRWRQVIRRGDIITRFHHKPVASVEELAKLLEGTRSGELRQLGIFTIGINGRRYVPLSIENLRLN